MKITILGLSVLLILLSGLFFSNSFAEILPTATYTLEGSGFAVTEKIIKTSGTDLVLSTQKQTGNSIKSSVEDGLITLGDKDFRITELEATILHEGKYFRINGIVESDTGDKVSISFFGKLVEESKNASIYGLTGRITIDDDYKIIYTAKLSELPKINVISKESRPDEKLTINILKGSSTKGAESYIGIKTDALRYFSQDRISFEPGTITIVNNDIVSHSILSGIENYGDRYNQFTPDGRISTDKILPGQSINIKLDKPGFYRLYDPDYQWMEIVAYVFPKADNVILGKGQNLGN